MIETDGRIFDSPKEFDGQEDVNRLPRGGHPRNGDQPCVRRGLRRPFRCRDIRDLRLPPDEAVLTAPTLFTSSWRETARI